MGTSASHNDPISTAGFGAYAIVKKYIDGFLEEMGVKDLGNQTAKALKEALIVGTRSDTAYYRLRSRQRKEPHFDVNRDRSSDLPDDRPPKYEIQPKADDLELAGYPPLLNLDLSLGGEDLV